VALAEGVRSLPMKSQVKWAQILHFCFEKELLRVLVPGKGEIDGRW
jgi:hypothetical protein